MDTKIQLNLQKTKTEIEFGVLPEILKSGEAYKVLTTMQENEHQQYIFKYSKKLYSKMNELLGCDRPKSFVSYRNWFSDPEKYVNKAFLENERRDKTKWLKIVNAMHFAVIETLISAIEDTDKNIYFYEERNKLLNKTVKKYIKNEKK